MSTAYIIENNRSPWNNFSQNLYVLDHQKYE